MAKSTTTALQVATKPARRDGDLSKYFDLLGPHFGRGWRPGLDVFPGHEPLLVAESLRTHTPLGPVGSLFLMLCHEVGPDDDDPGVLRAVNVVLAPTGRQFTPDAHGNAFLTIAHPDGTAPSWCLTAHLDTVEPWAVHPEIVVYPGPDGKGASAYGSDLDVWAQTKGDTILGADDRAGVAVVAALVARGVPGRYALFTGEEGGRKGSEASAKDLRRAIDDLEQALGPATDDELPLTAADLHEGAHPLGGVSAVVSLDRYGTHHVVTHQSGQATASTEYAEALADVLNVSLLASGGQGCGMLAPNTGGSFTDSYSFRDTVRECPNLSIGYIWQHTDREVQNLSYLDRLADALAEVDLGALPCRDTVTPARTRTPSRFAQTWDYSRYFADRDADLFADMATADDVLPRPSERDVRTAYAAYVEARERHTRSADLADKLALFGTLGVLLARLDDTPSFTESLSKDECSRLMGTIAMALFHRADDNLASLAWLGGLGDIGRAVLP